MGDASAEQGQAIATTQPIETLDLVAQATAPDWFLQHLVLLANAGGVEAGLTLVCGGTIVSGILVSGADYVRGFREEFTADLPPESKDAVGPLFDFLAGPYSGTPDGEDGPAAERTMYIHLRDARFYAAGQLPIPANRGVWWRGRLASVSGFSLGQLTADVPGR
jgi:hypothetical protein